MTRTPKGRTLGGALRKARQERGLTLRQLAKMIGRDQGVLSRWENGERAVRPEYVAQILTTLGVSGGQYDDLIALAYRTDDPLWVATTLPEHRRQLMALLDCEQNATKIIDVSQLLIPGSLQTSDYTRAMMEIAGLPTPEISTRVTIRAGRKDIITRPDPIRFSAAVFSSTLTNIIGRKEIMIEQLRHLLDMAKLPNVDLHVLPVNSGWTPALEGPFYLIYFDRLTSVVHLENRRSGLFLHEQEDVDSYRVAADLVFNASLSGPESVELIAKALNMMEEL